VVEAQQPRFSMSILTASNLAKSYGPHDVFEGISLEIPNQAKIALVGPNGSGKTTLLRLIAGLEKPTTGDIYRAKRKHVAYLPQQADFSSTGTLREAMLAVFADLQQQAAELRRLEAAIADPATRERALQRYGSAMEAFELAGGYTYEWRIDQVLSGLGFAEEDFQRPLTQLSGGQKTRALLARLLLEEPDLLLLDEPTNHLDLAGIEWLEDYLKAWKGAVVIVAHDRAFLDALVEQVWELSWGRLEQYRGDYSAYTSQRVERLNHQQTEYEQQQEFIAQTEEFIRRNIAGQRSQAAKGRQKRLARLERIEQPHQYRPMNLSLDDATRSGDLVVGLYGLSVGYDPVAPLFVAEEFELRRGQRVALVGPNGSGKTTLIRTILGDLPPLAGRVRIGDDDVFKRIGDLSGGEQARVALATLMLHKANALILDEPTNHLDIPSQEVLQQALAEFDGTLLLVTHDRYLIRRLATCVWAIEDGQLWEFREGYEAYRHWKRLRAQEGQASQGGRREIPGKRGGIREAHKALKRERARRGQRQDELEEEIHKLERRRAQLGAKLAVASEQQAIEQVRRLGTEYSQVEAELNALLIAWADAV